MNIINFTCLQIECAVVQDLCHSCQQNTSPTAHLNTHQRPAGIQSRRSMQAKKKVCVCVHVRVCACVCMCIYVCVCVYLYKAANRM